MRTKRPHLSVVKLLKNRVLPQLLTTSPQSKQMLDASPCRIAALICQQQRNEIMKDFFVAVKSISHCCEIFLTAFADTNVVTVNDRKQLKGISQKSLQHFTSAGGVEN